MLDTTDCRTREHGLNKGNTMNENITKLNNELELSDEHASDVALIGTCRKCEQNDPTYRYDDCPNDDIDDYNEGCVAPDSISTGHAHFSGAYVATCNLCDYVCAYWDCACELEHDCVDLKDGE